MNRRAVAICMLTGLCLAGCVTRTPTIRLTVTERGTGRPVPDVLVNVRWFDEMAMRNPSFDATGIQAEWNRIAHLSPDARRVLAGVRTLSAKAPAVTVP